MFSVIILLLASLVASAVLFRPTRVTVYLATSAVLFEVQWLFITLLVRTVPNVHLPVFGLCSLLLIGWLCATGLITKPAFANWLIKEGVVLLIMLVVIAAAGLIWTRNGQSGAAWINHGYFNGDTATLVALTQRSLTESTLVTSNPFAGNGSLEYPTLLHAAIANVVLTLGISGTWLQWLRAATLGQIAITIPLFFLLWECVVPEPANRQALWLGIRARRWVYLAQGFIVAYVIALSWDNFVYPQSHFFLTAAYLLEAALVGSASKQTGARRLLLLGVAILTAVVLLGANAVTGTAAVALLATFFWLQASTRSQSVTSRAGAVGAILILTGLFLAFTPGEAAFGWPHFSYTAANDLMRLAPIMLLLWLAAWMVVSQPVVLRSAVMLLSTLAIVTFLFSTRDIVVANASRFFYHALLIGFPLLLRPLIQSYYWLRRQLLFTSATLAELVTGYLAVSLCLLLLLFPAGASVLQTFDALLFQDEQVISDNEQQALQWIKANTIPTAVFITSLDTPRSIPFFTGRAILRTDFWLSPDDIVRADTEAAFAGERAAQEKIARAGNYLWLTTSEQNAWQPLGLPAAYRNEEITIYQIQ